MHETKCIAKAQRITEQYPQICHPSTDASVSVENQDKLVGNNTVILTDSTEIESDSDVKSDESDSDSDGSNLVCQLCPEVISEGKEFLAHYRTAHPKVTRLYFLLEIFKRQYRICKNFVTKSFI